MGLDSYLYAKQTFTSASWGKEDERKKVKSIARMLKATKFVDEDDLQFGEMQLQIGYWRKSNHIHKFFVDKCGGGKDVCQRIYVELDDIKKLKDLCESVLKDRSVARELLPTQSGFFFGATDYDHWYYEDIEYTIPILEKIIKNYKKEWELYYQASW